MDILDTTIAKKVPRSGGARAATRQAASDIREEDGRVTVVPRSALPA